MVSHMKSITLTTLLTVLVSAALAGCSSMSKQNCEDANWENVGRYDGSQGRPLKDYELAKNQCEIYSRTPDEVAYMKGYNEGLLTYCTEKNGEILGRTGSRYFENCPDNLKSTFLRSYRYGLSQFKVQMNRDRLEAYQLQRESDQINPETPKAPATIIQ